MREELTKRVRNQGRIDFQETKTVSGFVQFSVNAEKDNEDDRIYTSIAFSGQELLEAIEKDGVVTVAFQGAAERRATIEGLRWMADRLEAL